MGKRHFIKILKNYYQRKLYLDLKMTHEMKEILQLSILKECNLNRMKYFIYRY